MIENAPLATDHIREKIREIVASVTVSELDEVSAGARLKEDLGVDSLLSIELMLLINEEFGIEIPDKEFAKVLTVDEAVPVVQSYCSSSGPPKRAD
jgi:acyl carrier protein